MVRSLFLSFVMLCIAIACTDKKNAAAETDVMIPDDGMEGPDMVGTTDGTDIAVYDADEPTDDTDRTLSDETSQDGLVTNDDEPAMVDEETLSPDEVESDPDNLATDTDTSSAIDFDDDPGLDLPAGNHGRGIYFSAHTAENNRGDIYRLKMDGLVFENITNTPEKYEYCPALPADGSFLLYSSADYSDMHLGSIWKATLNGQGLIVGQPTKLIASQSKQYDVYGDGSMMQEYTVGRWNPSVSEDGARIVFTGTYETDQTDANGYLILDIEIFTADANGGNITPFFPSGDGNPMYLKPLAAEFVHGTSRVMASFLGFGPNEMSSEIYFEDADGLDMTAYTFYGAWTDGNVAQRGLAAAIHTDEMLFYRFVPDAAVPDGLYIMSTIIDAPWNETYSGYRAPTETFVIPLTSDQFASHYRPFAFSPDGALIAVAVYVGSGSTRESRLAIIGRDGTLYRVFNLDHNLRDIDGLIWR